jgi:hypothetical protein
MRALTAAHRSLPFGTVVLLEKLVNGRSIELRIARRDKLREHIQLIDQFLVKMPSALVVGKEALTIGRLIERVPRDEIFRRGSPDLI